MNLDDLHQRASALLAGTGLHVQRVMLGDVERILIENEVIVPHRLIRISSVSDVGTGWDFAMFFSTYGQGDHASVEGRCIGGIETTLSIIRKWIVVGDSAHDIKELRNPTKE